MVETATTIAPASILRVITADWAEVAHIGDQINITDRAGISVYGANAQQSVSSYAGKILDEVRNR